MVLAEPAAGVVDDETPHHRAVRAIKVHRLAPARFVAVRRVVARELLEEVAVGSEMVVDDVEDDADASRVRGVYESPESVRAAVYVRRREQVHAVVAPVAPAGELGDGHQLDRRNA